jgi:hypothetical protein
MHRPALLALSCLTYLMLVAPASAESPDAQVAPLPSGAPRLAQAPCSRRMGPFATQETAWRRWREARGQGIPVSSGVFPCYDSSYPPPGTRGYCFNVFSGC